MCKLKFRKAELCDVDVYFKWLNDLQVRENSFDSRIVIWENHVRWFNEHIKNPNYFLYIFQDINNENIGQVRIQKISEIESIIGISICSNHRGLGYGQKMLIEVCNEYFKVFNNSIINAYIKNNNISSRKMFEKAGFSWLRNILYKNFNTDHYIIYADRKL
jgi:spore coat polysaccharide biosynthesis protein SpsF